MSSVHSAHLQRSPSNGLLSVNHHDEGVLSSPRHGLIQPPQQSPSSHYTLIIESPRPSLATPLHTGSSMNNGYSMNNGNSMHRSSSRSRDGYPRQASRSRNKSKDSSRNKSKTRDGSTRDRSKVRESSTVRHRSKSRASSPDRHRSKSRASSPDIDWSTARDRSPTRAKLTVSDRSPSRNRSPRRNGFQQRDRSTRRHSPQYNHYGRRRDVIRCERSDDSDSDANSCNDSERYGINIVTPEDGDAYVSGQERFHDDSSSFESDDGSTINTRDPEAMVNYLRSLGERIDKLPDEKYEQLRKQSYDSISSHIELYPDKLKTDQENYMSLVENSPELIDTQLNLIEEATEIERRKVEAAVREFITGHHARYEDPFDELLKPVLAYRSFDKFNRKRTKLRKTLVQEIRAREIIERRLSTVMNSS